MPPFASSEKQQYYLGKQYGYVVRQKCLWGTAFKVENTLVQRRTLLFDDRIPSLSSKDLFSGLDSVYCSMIWESVTKPEILLSTVT